MSNYSEYFLNSLSTVVQLECLEISHSKFTQTYYIVRNATQGVTVTHEDGSTHDYQYYPLKLKLSGPQENLDHVLTATFGDLGEIIPSEIDAIRAGDGFAEYPVVRYRVYRSDDLATVLYGPLYLQIKRLNPIAEGCTFEASAPSLNVNATGERYKLSRFPMLRGLL